MTGLVDLTRRLTGMRIRGKHRNWRILQVRVADHHLTVQFDRAKSSFTIDLPNEFDGSNVEHIAWLLPQIERWLSSHA